MKIGIMGAMPEEIALLREVLGDRETKEVGGRSYTLGELEGHEVTLVFSRWGKVAAASTATTLIDRFGAELIIFTGVAGGARAGIDIGDIVIANNLIQHDVDASPSSMFARYEIPLLGLTHFPVSNSHVALAMEAATDFLTHRISSFIEPIDFANYCLRARSAGPPRVIAGTVASGDQFIADSAKLRSLGESIEDLACVEMEGAAVAQVCYEHGVPCIVIRSISDKADETAHIDFPGFVKHIASKYSFGIVEAMLERLH